MTTNNQGADASESRARTLLLEELALAAWPALMTIHHGGYVLRLAEGYTKRANSMNALYPPAGESEADLLARVAWAEAVLAQHRQSSILRLSPLADPRLDALLAARGYAHADETIVMLAERFSGADDARVEVRPDVGRDWIEAYAATADLPPASTATLARMMALIAPRHATARVTADGRIVGFGLGVLDRGHIGAFEILTTPSHRRMGLGRAIMGALLGWGAREGATRAYLQVVAANTPAIALYRELGYREVYRYHYRIGTRKRAS